MQKLNITWRDCFEKINCSVIGHFQHCNKKVKTCILLIDESAFALNVKGFPVHYTLQLFNFNILAKLLKTALISNNLDFPLVPNLPYHVLTPSTDNRIYIDRKYDKVEKPGSFQFAYSNFQKYIAIYTCIFLAALLKEIMVPFSKPKIVISTIPFF